MEIVYDEGALKDIAYWKKLNNPKKLAKIQSLIADIQKTPTKGLGKPEALKHKYSGYWSRRIDQENRIIYKILDDKIVISRLKDHYE